MADAVGLRGPDALPDRIEHPLLVRNAEPDWLKDDLRPPPAGPLWEMGDTAARWFARSVTTLAACSLVTIPRRPSPRPRSRYGSRVLTEVLGNVGQDHRPAARLTGADHDGRRRRRSFCYLIATYAGLPKVAVANGWQPNSLLRLRKFGRSGRI